MQISFKENSSSKTPMTDLDPDILYKTDAGEFCIKLDNDELLFIDDRGFILVPNAHATHYIMDNKTATKLHNVKITISYDC